LTKPSGNAVGSELEDMFARLSRKRRASGAMANIHKESRFDDAFGAPTPGGPGLTSAFQFDDDNIDYGQDYTADVELNQEAFNRFNNNVRSFFLMAITNYSIDFCLNRWTMMNLS
jgi:hypothetical protein